MGDGARNALYLGISVRAVLKTATMNSRYQLHRWALAVGLLGAIGCGRAVLFRKPPNADAYFKRVAKVAAEMPTTFGYWVSTDAPVPQAAVTMLRPNITVSRRYSNLQTGQQASFLLVQCSDATSLQGHYPPVCYVAHGFKQLSASPEDWKVDGLKVHGTLYAFTSAEPEDPTSMIIYDFMILPTGVTCHDMDGVNAIARDPQKRAS